MALTDPAAALFVAPRAAAACAPAGVRNDAFSFWKLPEEWRAALADKIPVSEAIADRYLFEKYLDDNARRPPAKMRVYYGIKSLIPAAIRHRINAFAVRSRQPRKFPHWPCEDVLLDYWRAWLAEALKRIGASDGWHVAFWPRGLRCCIVLTHDVESPRGFQQIERMADLEEEFGFKSAWNIPLAQYPVDWRRTEALRRRGFELGAHGLRHDGRLFRSERDFAALKPLLERLAQEHGLRGFRAPSTLRRADLIATMRFEFDSSFSDTDPYEPQPGGSCSVFPFFLSGLVELPYTLAQDHTLIHLLGRNPLPLWEMKARWIASLGGMILTLTHPDYCGIEPHLSAYRELLKKLAAIEHAWRALPSEVAAWWRKRNAITLTMRGAQPVLAGAGDSDAAACRLSEAPLAQVRREPWPGC
jgi:peptidoglycan/xylan/chitin deacetylase (PgdA/CDA1 family)